MGSLPSRSKESLQKDPHTSSQVHPTPSPQPNMENMPNEPTQLLSMERQPEEPSTLILRDLSNIEFSMERLQDELMELTLTELPTDNQGHLTLKTMISIDGLPDELTELILIDLPKSDLLNVARTTKKLSRVATDCIYRRVHLTDYTDLRKQQEIFQLLSNLSFNPRWGGLIQHFSVCSYESPSNGPMEDERLNAIIESITAVTDSAPYPKSLNDLAIAAILFQAKNIKTLRFKLCYDPRYSHPDYFPGAAGALRLDWLISMRLVEYSISSATFGGGVMLGNLTELVMDRVDAPRWDIRALSILVRLPSLRRVVGTGCGYIPDTGSWSCEPGSSNITELTLLDCTARVREVRQLAALCPRLAYFEFDGSCTVDLWHSVPRDPKDDLIATLAEDCRSLRRLRIGSLHRLHERHFPRDLVIGHLTALDGLKDVELDASVVWRAVGGPPHHVKLGLADILPPNLENVCFALSEDGGFPTCDEFWSRIDQLLLTKEGLKGVTVRPITSIQVRPDFRIMPHSLWEEVSKGEFIGRRRTGPEEMPGRVLWNTVPGESIFGRWA